MPATSTDFVTDHPSRYTLGGKEIKLFMKKNTSLYCARFADGGELPKELANQMFTSPKEAYSAIDSYLARMEEQSKNKKEAIKKDK